MKILLKKITIGDKQDYGSELGTLLSMLNKPGSKIFKEVSMGDRFGKYADAKRKAQIRRIRAESGDVPGFFP